ncbi:MAG: anthranilate phosphoribosyltransferase [Chloroflexi bacterium]|nr:anthranilate phosphoribosyltransferase [Chloroflexota bacterium]
MIAEAIAKLVDGHDLTEEEAGACMDEIMAEQATAAQFGAFVVALRLKGETVDEITGMARAMRDKALRVRVEGPLLDTCGTGGDGKATFNASTAAAFVAAGAGAKVAKHGNRAMTSACGSADVLEALGASLAASPEDVILSIGEVGFGFMFAQAFHPAMKFAAGLRREIGVRTVFNILGPLTNPAGAEAQVLGVASAELGEKLANVLLNLGTKHALVVFGEDGFDEVSLSAPTTVYEVQDGKVRNYTVTPEDMGVETQKPDAVSGGAAGENAKALRAVLSGEAGPLRDFTLINAAAALVAGDLASDLKEGAQIAAKSIDSGAALEKLDAFVRVSNGGK